MKIGILECGHTESEIAEKHGTLPTLFANLLDGHGFTFENWDVENLIFPPDEHFADGWLVTGSIHGVYEDHAFIPTLENFIRQAYSAGVPTVGICFGHQLIAQALGGRVEKFQGGWTIGHQVYNFEDHGELGLNAWHQDQVIERPVDARVIASNDFCTNAALLYGNRALTIQAHPELGSPIIAAYLKMCRGTRDYDDATMDRAEDTLTRPDASAFIGNQIASFFKAAHLAR